MTLLETQLPTGWAWKPISSAFRITKKPRGLAIPVDELVPFIPMDFVPVGGRQDVAFEMRSRSEIASGTYFEKDDILLAKITPSFENGKQGLSRNLPKAFGFASTELIPLQPIDGMANRHFLFYYLLHPEVRSILASKMEGTTGRQRVPEHVIQDFPYPAAPAIEQQRVAAVLSKIQCAIEVEDNLITSSRQLKRSAIQELISFGLKGDPPKETEIGTIPASWTLRPLHDLRHFLQYGTSAKCDYHGKGNPVLRIPNIVAGMIDATDLKWCELPPKETENLLLADGDIAFIRTNAVRERVGRTAVYHGTPERALFASYLIRARLKTELLHPDFLQYFTDSEKGASQLSGRASPAADGKFNINTKTIDALLVPVPSPDEQREIVSILQLIDRKITAGLRKRETLLELFKTLLNQLMTGETRVTDLDIDTSEVAVH